MDKLKKTTWGLILIITFLFPDLNGQETNHWETIVFSFNSWYYIPGSEEIPSEWKDPGFDLTGWKRGRGGIGYGDGDDETVIEETISLFMRLDFNISDTSVITQAIFNADYDDGFVAYLNGVEIARSNIGTPGVPPAWDEVTPENHEAQLYQGGVPESFIIPASMLDTLLFNGPNTLAVQVHNRGINSSDLSSNFFFSAGISVPELQYFYPPEWFYTPFESTNLPLMLIETNGQSISKGNRIVAEMGLMDYSYLDKRNSPEDSFNIYNGRIAIEYRGSSSLMFPKKNFNFETQNEAGENLNIPLLGLPVENDWVLHGPYSDKTLIRNVLSYHIAATTGRYAPRTRWIELMLNGQYQGVYVLTEKIKQDDNRVDIARLYPQDISGDQLTGGYIVQIDRDDPEIEDDGWYSRFRSNVFYAYHDPGYDELVQEQKDYIRSFIERFENTAQYGDDEKELISWIDVGSFVDYFIPTEIYNHVDGWKLSFYMYKDLDSKGGKLQFGPVWDLNLAYGNSDFGPEPLPTGWTWERTEASAIFPFWVYKLMQTDTLRNRIACRWQELRESILQTENIMNFIDINLEYIEEARIRNFQRWPVLGIYVWPNNYVGTDYDDEVNYLTEWLQQRLAWMDENMVGTCIPVSSEEKELPHSAINIFPNPFNQYLTFSFNRLKLPARIEIYNVSSTFIKSFEIESVSGQKIYLGDLQPGMYFYRVNSSGEVLGSGKLVKR